SPGRKPSKQPEISPSKMGSRPAMLPGAMRQMLSMNEYRGSGGGSPLVSPVGDAAVGTWTEADDGPLGLE
ncbi:MAG: hypothetical protein ACRDK3_11585, partial [Actinomycetota bacterium]